MSGKVEFFLKPSYIQLQYLLLQKWLETKLMWTVPLISQITSINNELIAQLINAQYKVCL